jgi:hypothetical protein
MQIILIKVGNYQFEAQLLIESAPKTCEAFLKLLPFKNKLIQARWSGESAWIPMGELNLGIAEENATSTPEVGEILLYPNGISETEILFPYGKTIFACRDGKLKGNLFLKIHNRSEDLKKIGQLVLLEGAQEILFTVK